MFSVAKSAEALGAGFGKGIVQTQLAPGAALAPGKVSTTTAAIVLVDKPLFDTTELLIGAIILVVLAVAFYFVRGFVVGVLISGNARPQKAALAGWLFFLMLLTLAATAIFGYLAQVWVILPAFGTLIGLNLILAAAFLSAFVSAKRSARVL